MDIKKGAHHPNVKSEQSNDLLTDNLGATKVAVYRTVVDALVAAPCDPIWVCKRMCWLSASVNMYTSDCLQIWENDALVRDQKKTPLLAQEGCVLCDWLSGIT